MKCKKKKKKSSNEEFAIFATKTGLSWPQSSRVATSSKHQHSAVPRAVFQRAKRFFFETDRQKFQKGLLLCILLTRPTIMLSTAQAQNFPCVTSLFSVINLYRGTCSGHCYRLPPFPTSTSSLLSKVHPDMPCSQLLISTTGAICFLKQIHAQRFSGHCPWAGRGLRTTAQTEDKGTGFIVGELIVILPRGGRMAHRPRCLWWSPCELRGPPFAWHPC